jgi:alpha-beta hydrolase superfamily lysophospholipase
MRLEAIALILSTTMATAAEPVTGTHARTFQSKLDGSEQPYNLYIPTARDGVRSLPLVVALHGKGATWESWFAATTVREWAEEEGFIVVTPHGRGNWFYLGPGETDVLEVIEDVAAFCEVDRDRIYLIGHSMGGFGTWHLAASHPDTFAAIVPMATWPPLSLLPNLRHTPTLLIHGDADAAVPIEWSEMAAAAMVLVGGEFTYVRVPGVGHESKMISDSFPRIGDFLRDKRRPQNPREVTLKAYSPRRGKAWWLTLHEVQRFGKLASLEASAGPARLDIATQNVLDFSIDPRGLQLPSDGSVPISIDNQLLSVPCPGPGDAIFARQIDGMWTVRLASRDSIATTTAKPVAEFRPAGQSLPSIIAQIARNKAGVDAFLIANDLIAPELTPGTLNEDQLLDLFLRPEDEICIVELTAKEAGDLIAEREWYPAWWGDLTMTPTEFKTERVTIGMPRVMATRLPFPHVQTPMKLRELIILYTRSTGQLSPIE